MGFGVELCAGALMAFRIQSISGRPQFQQPFSGFAQGCFFLAEAEPDDLSAALRRGEKAGAWHCRNAGVLDHVPCESYIVREIEVRDVTQNVVRTLRAERPKARLFQQREQKVATRTVFRRESVIVAVGQVQRVRACHLQRMRCAYGEEIVYLPDY